MFPLSFLCAVRARAGDWFQWVFKNWDPIVTVTDPTTKVDIVLSSADHVLGTLEAPAVSLVGGYAHGSSRSTEWEESKFFGGVFPW